MLNGFTLDEKWVALDEDDGEMKTEFLIRSLPAAKYDELQGESYELSQRLADLTGADVARNRAYAREYVRWACGGHRNGAGGLADCKTEQRTFGGQDFTVLSDDTLTVYERTQVASAPVVVDGKEVGTRPVYLLARLLEIAQRAQTLSLAERRGLHGAGVAGTGSV